MLLLPYARTPPTLNYLICEFKANLFLSIRVVTEEQYLLALTSLTLIGSDLADYYRNAMIFLALISRGTCRQSLYYGSI